ncbi:SSI family serine proteinase inhibitor [Actinoallomurus sp. NPDC050550]|uniref:SSI family serine proteinase inhibitor n=1 Tax=Actinoallomurus sp. NPDC050550 TaxID=3154937 RepID=UPI0033CD60FC
MRRFLAFSIAAAIPATFSAAPAGAQSRPAPPATGAHGRAAASQRLLRHVRPVPRGTVVHDMSAASIAPGAGTAPGASPGAPSLPGDVAATPTAASPQASVAASPAQSIAAGGGQAAHGPTQLTLTTVVGSATPKTVTLQCDPVGGTHPKAEQACADVAKTHGDFKLASDEKNPRACFMIYSPVTTSAEGQLRGEAVKYTARFPNTCMMRTQTGSIFDF